MHEMCEQYFYQTNSRSLSPSHFLTQSFTDIVFFSWMRKMPEQSRAELPEWSKSHILTAVCSHSIWTQFPLRKSLNFRSLLAKISSWLQTKLNNFNKSSNCSALDIATNNNNNNNGWLIEWRSKFNLQTTNVCYKNFKIINNEAFLCNLTIQESWPSGREENSPRTIHNSFISYFSFN